MTDVRNVADLVRRAASETPAKTAFICGERSLTWSDLDRDVDAIAAGLAERGLSAGRTIALCLPNSPDFVASYFGVLRAGLVAVPLNTGYTAGELAHQLRDARVELLICGPDDEAAAEAAGAMPQPIPVVRSLDDLRTPDGRPPSVAAGAEDLAVLLYTAGTTGRPKGAMLSHRALLANLDQLARLEPPSVVSDDVVLLVVPLFHIYGLNAALGMVARSGATGVLVDRFDPVQSLTEIKRCRVTNVVGAPPMFIGWSMLPEVGEAFSDVRVAVSGAAPLAPSVQQAMRTATGREVHEGYGLTECAPVLTTTLVSGVAKPGSIGRPLPGIELRLLDDAGAETEEDDPGEIVVRGANVFSGYWPEGDGGPDADGWFATGDVAYADVDGDLHLVDRRRDLILVSGFNVYPREVENVLIDHPDLAEVAVVGVPHPYTGETVKALVVPRDGATVEADDVVAFAARHLARFKCPTIVDVVATLPHSVAGKVAKGRLRDDEQDVA